MSTRKYLPAILGAFLLFAIAPTARADIVSPTLDPASFSATLAVGDSVTISKTLTLGAG